MPLVLQILGADSLRIAALQDRLADGGAVVGVEVNRQVVRVDLELLLGFQTDNCF